jgi:hypothetical protein
LADRAQDKVPFLDILEKRLVLLRFEPPEAKVRKERKNNER